MKIVITGITGFIGQHLARELLMHGHEVIGVARDRKSAERFDWYQNIVFIESDLHKDYQPVIQIISNSKIDALIHLAWPGLPNYKDGFHIFKNLPSDLLFLKDAIAAGVPQLVVAGTCFEYGLKSGALSEDMETMPITAYGFAKDVLRKSLEFLQKENQFVLQWVRFFYLHGEGQNKNSLLPKLDLAIDECKLSFDMSEGNQLRDYLSIGTAVKNMRKIIENRLVSGVINCSSGTPISVLQLVKNRCEERASKIHINTGVYPIPDYEPFEFWGIPKKLTMLN